MRLSTCTPVDFQRRFAKMSARKRSHDDKAGDGEGAGAPPPPPGRRRTRGVIAALRAPDVAYERRLKLTDVIGFVALNGYAREANACAGLCRETWRCIPAGLSAADADRVRRDHPLWQAIIDLGHGKWEQTRLKLAVRRGSLARVRELCDWRADVEVGTPLITASSIGRIDLMRELLAHGAIVEAKASSGWTSLHAASFVHLDVVRELLAHGANTNAVNVKGETPLILASRDGRTKVVRALLAAGADKHYVSNNGATATSDASTFQYAPAGSRAAILALLAAAP